MTPPWATVCEQVVERTERVVAEVRDRWGTSRTVDSFDLGPRPFDAPNPPNTVAEQIDLIAGIASVVLFYTSVHEETVLVYNPGGFWEPPGGVIESDQTPEEAARAEALEETGLDIELTDLLYSGTFEFHYASGANVTLPVAQFVGHRVDGSLHIEREGRDHPGVTRATGLFDLDVFPHPCRDEAEIRRLLEDAT